MLEIESDVPDRGPDSGGNFFASMGAALIGVALGAGFYFVVALGILYTAVGPDYWIGRVMSSWINLFSFIAFAVAMMLLLVRWMEVMRMGRGFKLGLLSNDPEILILPDDARQIRKRLGQLPEKDQALVPVSLLSSALQRARANWSAVDAGEAVKTQAELLQGQVDSQYATIRYLAWAIPSIGFVGTVLGIGEAMGAIKPSEESDVNPMEQAANHLSMAFDTTFVALVLSLILMYFLYKIQADDDSLLVRATDWCMKRFVFRMHIPEGADA